MNWFLSQETLRRPTNYAKNMFVNVSAILNLQNSAGFILRFIVMVCQGHRKTTFIISICEHGNIHEF